MKRLFQLLIIIGLLLFAVETKAKPKEKTIEWTTTYVANEDKSLSEAKKEAALQAELDAMACEFGTYLSTTNYTAIRNGESHFSSTNVSQIRGEKIRDLEAPKYDVQWKDGMLVIKCSVKFVGREIEQSQTDLDIKILRNGYSEKFESTTFKHNDDFYLSFKAPVDGHLAIFISDDVNNTFTLLPYPKEGIPSFPIKHGKNYLFFCDDKKFFMQNPKIESPKNFANVEGIRVTTEKESEINQITVVFSPKDFSQPNASTDGDLNYLSTNNFHDWLAKCRIDRELTVKTIDIIVNRK